MKQVFELPGVTKGVGAVAYSKGGNYLAVGDGPRICVYDPYNFKMIKFLKGH